MGKTVARTASRNVSKGVSNDVGEDAASRPPPSTGGSGRAFVSIRVPARPEYVGILRAACTQLGPVLGWGSTEITDLRLAVDEATGFLLRNCVKLGHGAAQDRLTASFAVDGPRLRVILATEADASVAPDADEFGWAILTALVDEFTWRVEGSTVRVEIRKQHAEGRQE